MDFLKNAANQASSTFNNAGTNQQQQGSAPVDGQQQQQQGGSGGLLNSLNGLAGGGAQGEAKEDYLDKAVDYAQEKYMGAGDQSNENAVEQAKDEAISDAIRDNYRKMTGSDFPIADKN